MTITFFSNFFNHHQKPLCDAFDVQVHVKFTFVTTIESTIEKTIFCFAQVVMLPMIIGRLWHFRIKR